VEELKKLIKQELKYCRKDKSKVVSEEYKKGFIKGLEQVLFFIDELNNKIRIEKNKWNII